MRQKTSRLFRYLVSAFGLGAVIGWSPSSDADIQQIVIDQTTAVNFAPITLGTSTPGSATSYTIYTGRVFGELKPDDPDNNKIITDIHLAPKNKGRVEYIANFEIITPTDPSERSGLMIHAVPNRGNNAITTSALIQGATYVQSGWQGDLLAQCSPSPAIPYPCFDLSSGPYGSLNTTTGVFTPPQVSDVAGASGLKSLASFVVQVPVATNPNGKDPITGQVYSHVCTGTNGCGLAVGTTTSTAQLVIQGPAFAPYQPASMDTSQAEFWTVSSQTFEGVDSGKTPIPSDQWAWAYCPSGWPGTPNPNWICLKNGPFNPSLLYEMVYTAKDPLVLGVGFAAFRDLGSFLRYETAAPGGGSNPISGTVQRTYTVGSSQSGAFIHGFIFWGFNKDENSRIVFDGAWPQVDGRMMVMNIRWGQPNNLMYLYMGGDEAPVWWADYPNLARGLPPNGMLHRCAQSNTCPQILETLGSAELYSEKMSASLCGFTCIGDIPLPSNVHRYYTPGATHGGGNGSFTWTAPNMVTIPPGQSLPNDPIPETFTNNALQYAFIKLLMLGTPMPPSVYPTLARGELVPNTAAAEGFPNNIPGLSYYGDQAWPPFVYNFGPRENYDQESGIPTIQPPIIKGVLPVYATRVNKDGNEEVTGLPTVLGEAPLGTYVGWNLATTGWYGPNASNGLGSAGQVFAGAGNSGGYWPFWDTKANRKAARDPRPSLQERYGTNAGYVCVVTAAANEAVQQRFLLASDAQMLISNATASNVLGPPYMPTPADMNRANSLCSH
jgi:Alpha/beta hydrolase domain